MKKMMNEPKSYIDDVLNNLLKLKTHPYLGICRKKNGR